MYSYEFRMLSFSLALIILISPFTGLLYSSDNDFDEIDYSGSLVKVGTTDFGLLLCESDTGWECPVCGRQNDNNYDFCPECGEPRSGEVKVGDIEVSDEWLCPNCGEVNYKSYRYCLNCREPRPDKSTLKELDERFLRKDIRWICPQCGNENKFYDEVCNNCSEARPELTSENSNIFFVYEQNHTIVNVGKWIMKIGGGILIAGGIMILAGLTVGSLGAAFTSAFLGMIGGPVLGTGFVVYIIGKLDKDKKPFNYDVNDYNGYNFIEDRKGVLLSSRIFGFTITL